MLELEVEINLLSLYLDIEQLISALIQLSKNQELKMTLFADQLGTNSNLYDV